ncbi:MAG: hypothetical protein PHI38_08105 [Sulfurimonas sp.]|uniref:hypothetical protein n=1 Tax=Sulfurimonas sp. TaxID=2022749 RepID=UPI00260AEBF1|nr:hypothetical protein [Sulfurimonas sp.]MDD3476816.1 hypothetical protein [Sulfurimonas sp.]
MKFEVIQNNYSELLKNIQSYFKNSQNSIHKARNEIKIINFKEKSFVVKSFKIPHLLNKIIYTFFKDSKAKKSYNNSLKTIEFTPKPIGYIEFQEYGLIDESYFISEHFDYDFTIREPLLNANFEEKEEVFKSFALFTLKLHENNIFHLDYSPGNILVKKEDESYIFKIVDINRMEFKSLSLDDRLQNFSKLWAKDDDLKVIIKEYARLMNENESNCIKIALKYSQAHKDKNNAKKRLKGIEVVD